MYTHDGVSEDYTSGNVYTVPILDPNGDYVCSVVIVGDDMSAVDTLLSHLNRQ